MTYGANKYLNRRKALKYFLQNYSVLRNEAFPLKADSH